MTESLRVFKLSNGESIVGSTLGENEIFDFNKPIQISYPLKMLVVPRMTKDGPYEDKIEKNKIFTIKYFQENKNIKELY